MSIEQFDPFSEAFHADPYPFYRAMLEHDVLAVEVNPNFTARYVARHEHVSALLRDPRMVHGSNDWSPPPAMADYFAMTSRWMLFRDPPDHTRLRTLVNRAFTPQAVARLRERTHALAHALLDGIDAAQPFDLISSYAFELPVQVISEMLGVPAGDRRYFRNWSQALAAAIDFTNSEEPLLRANKATVEMRDYLLRLIAAKQAEPGDDILSALLQAGQDGGRLTLDEVFATCGLLLFAGHETTVNLIGNGTLALLRHPDQLAALKARPELLPNAVEEILRYDSPVQATTRRAAQEIALGDAVVPAGAEVTLVMGGANRDPRVFERPDDFDITRQNIRHLAFGAGIHYCVGAPLARMEGEVGLSALFERLPGLSLEGTPPEWQGVMVLRGLKRLLVRA